MAKTFQEIKKTNVRPPPPGAIYQTPSGTRCHGKEILEKRRVEKNQRTTDGTEAVRTGENWVGVSGAKGVQDWR